MSRQQDKPAISRHAAATHVTPLRGLLLGLTLLVSACAGDPWVDSRREAGIPGGRIGESTPDRVAICHAASTPGPILTQMATQECGKSRRSPVYVGTLKYQCRFDTPHRSYFDCK